MDNDQDINDYNFTVAAHNITEAITGIKNWFNKEGDYENTFTVKTVRKDQMKTNTTDASENIALSNGIRLLMHYMGDVH